VPVVVCSTLVCVLLPTGAEAHLVTTGLGPVYDGISHVVLSPDDLVPALIMALLAGMNGAIAGRRALFALTAAWLFGGIAAFLVGQPVVPAAAATASFLVLGVLTAADRRLSPTTVATVAAAVGLLHGWLNGVSIVDARREALGLAGIIGAIFVMVTVAAALAVSIRAVWARVAVRVVGSWVAAVGLLMLGWALRPVTMP
jgi:hydrogenase/urease accessory protein HupE